MMDGNHRSNQDPSTGKQPHLSGDDDTVVTPTRGEQAKKTNNVLFTEKTLRFRFPPMTDGNPVAPSVLHARWMCVVQEEFGEEVHFFDNKNRRVPSIDPIRLDPKLIKAQFAWYTQPNKNKPNVAPQSQSNDRRSTQYILHRIRTSRSLSDIKANHKVRSLVNEHNFFVNDHRWNETEWDTMQLGFFFGIDPSFYDVDQATAQITETIKTALGGKKIPKFRIAFTSPKTTYGRRTISTKAYAIESQRSSSHEMISILKKAFKTTGAFVPYQMRRKHPESFQKMIRAQTSVLANNRIIHLNHIGSEAMYYMTDHIMAVPGVKAILPTKHADQLGQYKVSVLEKDFQRVRDHFLKYLQAWYDQYVEPDAQNPELKFPGPPIVAPIEADDYSDDDQSYMTVSINTAMSLASVLSDETITEPTETKVPKNLGTKKWSDVVSEVTYNSSGTHDKGRKEEPQSDVAIMTALSSSREEVDALKAQVAELLAEREKTAHTIAEAVTQQVAKALAERLPTVQEDQVTGQQFSQFIQTQDQKFEALTSMFAQMMAQQMQLTQPRQATVLMPVPMIAEQVTSPPTLGKRNAPLDLEDVINSDSMETEEPDNTRKRPDYRMSPQKPPPPRELSKSAAGIPPRQLNLSSPCNVPLPASPSAIDHQTESKQAGFSEDADVLSPANKNNPAQYQQQSISRYLTPESSIPLNPTPPSSPRSETSTSQDGSHASLSEAEDAQSTRRSGNESKTKTHQARRGSGQGTV